MDGLLVVILALVLALAVLVVMLSVRVSLQYIYITEIEDRFSLLEDPEVYSKKLKDAASALSVAYEMQFNELLIRSEEQRDYLLREYRHHSNHARAKEKELIKFFDEIRDKIFIKPVSESPDPGETMLDMDRRHVFNSEKERKG
jgi:hypothetical protein